MTLRLRYLSIALGFLVVALAASTGTARATPQFAVVGQAMATQPAQVENVTYYYNHGWGGYHYKKPSYQYHRYPSYRSRYQWSPWWRSGRYHNYGYKPWYYNKWKHW